MRLEAKGNWMRLLCRLVGHRKDIHTTYAECLRCGAGWREVRSDHPSRDFLVAITESETKKYGRIVDHVSPDNALLRALRK